MSDSPSSNRSKKSIYKTRIDLKNESSVDSNEEIASTECAIRNRKTNLDPEALNEKLKHCVIRRSPSSRKNNQYLIRNSKVFEPDQDQICESSDSSDSNESETKLDSYNIVKNKHLKQSKEAKKLQKSGLICSKGVDFDQTEEQELSSEDSMSKRNQEMIEEYGEEIAEHGKLSSSWSKIKCTSFSDIKNSQEDQLRNQSSKSLISLLKIEAPKEEETEVCIEADQYEICQIHIEDLDKKNDFKNNEKVSEYTENNMDCEEQELLESLGELNKMSTLKLNELANSRYLNEKKRNEINSLIKNKSCFLRRVSSFPTRTLSKRSNSNTLYDVKSKIEQFEKIKNESSASTNFFVRGKFSRNSSKTGLMKTNINFQTPLSPSGTLKNSAKYKLPDLEEVCALIKVKDLKIGFFFQI
ncbi:hypothetical protein BpHYR1_018394 [Brachionus plicatilis]|uniref:Uncharacterized protein n=1 Tax=Brachionus plicatilis TaxID=10195 RepID=A0A3M7P6N2_BRAPC|nr:hypothetical protein BpHYR1_018394 [Brachionus plicatilis]